MPKRPEDEIQEKLVELELSIKDEETKKHLPNAHEGTGTAMAVTAPKSDAGGANADLYMYGGYGLIALGVILLLSHIQVGTSFWNYWGGGPKIGLLLLPLMVGIGMLFYNYKSVMARVVTLGSMAVIFFLLLSSMTITWQGGMVLLDFVLMGTPICIGGALLAKAQHKRAHPKD